MPLEWKTKVAEKILQLRARRKTNDDNLPIASLPANFVTEVAHNEEDIAAWVEAQPRIDFLGVDMEWKADFKINGDNTNNPACFLQISTLQSCLVVDLRELKDRSSPSIKLLFEDQMIVKAGIGVEMDKRKFESFFPTYVIRNWLDLGTLAKMAGIKAPGHGLTGQIHGVHSLCVAVLKQFFVDMPELTFTNWSAVEIDAQHLQYMALDAWLCAKIFFGLPKKLKQH